MLTVFLKRITIGLMAFVALFTAINSERWDDSYRGHEFPMIEAEQQACDTTRIMSFNIRCFDVNGVPEELRLDVGARQILEIMPDSVGLQEASARWMRYLDLFLGPYDWVGVDRESGRDPRISGESCPIFYLKTKFRKLDCGRFWLSDTPDEPSFGPGAGCRRVCTWVKLKNRLTGEVFVHVNTHFDHVSEEARVAGAEIVEAFIEEHFAGLPVVFTADMNAWENEPAYSVMTTNLFDAAKATDDVKTTGTFHAANPETHRESTIDFILCSDTIEVDNFRTVTKGVDGRFTSDHFPLYADIRFAEQKQETQASCPFAR